MSLTVLRRLPLLALVAVIACSSGPSPDGEGDYVANVTAERQKKDAFMREDPQSPIPVIRRDLLLPLKYYPADPSYSVPASLKLANERPAFEMPTSTGTVRKMERVGVLEFTLQGQPMSLGAFVEEGTQEVLELFVPFADMTTGTETYPAGRYLDLRPTGTGFYTIDFNKAYNPYCAYNSTYECPFPPPSNRLKLAVRAGEKVPGA
ncbi:MAG: DUF1684 domain-containing protein [Vicinamibacterales bacterium]